LKVTREEGKKFPFTAIHDTSKAAHKILPLAAPVTSHHASKRRYNFFCSVIDITLTVYQ
jgi:hypothetical protein